MSERRDLRFAVIGGGMAGILTAIRLDECGLHDYTVYEKADRLGGTWRENTYPGLACDVPSHLYTYSFAPNPDWTHLFSPGDEIWAYFEKVAAEHGILPKVRFGEEVTRLEWRSDDGSSGASSGRWRLETATGHRDTVDVVIAATGVLHHPNIPHFDGIETFDGAWFHSARWDHRVPLDGRRVGVVGTGSTAVQITSALVRRVAHYCLFQRTAQWIMPAPNPPYSDDDKAAFRAEPDRIRELHDTLDARFSMVANAIVDAESPAMQMVQRMCLENLENNVRDPELREKLRPSYRAACKRLVASPDFYDAIQQPNAELVTSPIERVEPGGVRTADGVLHELDVLVLATGFKTDSFMRPMEIVGRDGRRLADEWNPRPRAYLSVSLAGFPNLFMLNGPNGPVGNFSLIGIAEMQLDYVLQLVSRLQDGTAREISATDAAMTRHEDARTEAASKTIWMTGCRSWYLDDRGVPAVWPWTFDHFREVMAAPDFADYDVR